VHYQPGGCPHPSLFSKGGHDAAGSDGVPRAWPQGLKPTVFPDANGTAKSRALPNPALARGTDLNIPKLRP